MKPLITSGWLSLILPFFCLGLARATNMDRLDEQNRNVSGFRAIENASSADLEITMGNTETLKIIGNRDLIQHMETVVENGALKIHVKKGFERLFNGFGLHNTVRIIITAKNLDALKQVGSGDIVLNNTISGKRLAIASSGSGDLQLPIEVDELQASLSGSGDIQISGTATSAHILLTGSGDFSGHQLKTHNANVKTSGSGDAEIFVDQLLNASSSGSGDIDYAGHPKQINKQTSGSGDISGN